MSYEYWTVTTNDGMTDELYAERVTVVDGLLRFFDHRSNLLRAYPLTSIRHYAPRGER